MLQKEKQINNKSNTIQVILITAVVCLCIGFFGGMGFSKYSSGKQKTVQKHSLNTGYTQQKGVPNQFEQQVSALENEVSKNPSNGAAWTQLGNLYFDHDRITQAIDSYKKSLEIDPKNANVWTDIGVMYRRNKEFNKAINSFTIAIKLSPKHEVPLINKGIVLLYDLNDTVSAVETWEKLLQLNENARTSTGLLIKDIIQSVKR